MKIIGKFPQNIILGNTEICVIFANILDNAKEAILEYAGKRDLKWRFEIIVTDFTLR